uniref:phospholipase A2 n=1 Tax=Electrophorus electricus TaxID=8005 RepID=A0A4W4H8X2_ELEEL
MKIGIHCRLLQIVVMLSYFRAVIPDARNKYHEPFCLRTKSAFGQTHCSFLRRSAALAPLLFYWTIWTTDKHIEKCSISAEPGLIENYFTLCRERRTWDLKETQYLNLNISQLLEPNSPCEFLPNTLRHLRWNRRDLDLLHHSGGKIRQKRAWILPGTLWCGLGSRAGDYEQLGMFEPVDRCCREHDHCNHIIQPFTLNFGVFNPTLFTISHCDCDHRFKQCLLDINGTVSNMVGYTFFNILKIRCFDLIKKKGCTKINWFGMCTSVEVAPFAILKYPTPYNVVSSNHEKIVITEQSVYHAKSSINSKKINIKPKQRKRPESQGRYVHLTHLRRDALKLSEKLKHQYGTSKTALTRTTTLSSVWNTTTHLSSLTTHNSKLVHQKTQTVNQNRSELCPTISTHERMTGSQRCHDQKPLINQFSKKKSTHRRKMSASQSHTTAKQNDTIQSSKPLRAKINCLSIGPPRGDNLKLKQQRGKYCKGYSASKHKLNTTISPKFSTSSLAKIRGKKSKEKNQKQKIKVSYPFNISTFVEIKNKLTYVTKVSKTRKPSSAKQSPSICDAARYLDDCKCRIRPMEKIYGHYNTESRTIYHCDCIHKLTSHLKQLKKIKKVKFFLAKFVSLSCIEIPNIKECNKHTGCPAVLTKVTELESTFVNKEDEVTAKDERKSATKRASDQLYKHCLGIFYPRNPLVGNGLS